MTTRGQPAVRRVLSRTMTIASAASAVRAGDRRPMVSMMSGYQTAILAQLVESVYSVERIDGLIRWARHRFQQLGLRNIRLKHSDGSWGWPDYAPFDGIIVTAAPEQLPSALLEQLAVGGRLVIPVGAKGGEQILKRVTRSAEGYDEEELELVSFVPLIRGGG